MKEYRFILLGGDLRQYYLHRLLLEKGHHADLIYYQTYLKENQAEFLLQNADVVIFPVPTSQDKIHLFAPTIHEKIPLENITNLITPNSIIFSAGENSAITTCKARKKINLLADESMTIKNAMATAEAALSILIDKTQTTIFGTNILLLGYGRIARILSEYLNALHANVIVCARKETARTNATMAGCEVIGFDTLEQSLSNIDVVINTVPSLILGKKQLSVLGKDAVIIDLASKPGGIDFEAAALYGLKPIQALSLPGKNSPKSAAKFIEECINKTLI